MMFYEKINSGFFPMKREKIWKRTFFHFLFLKREDIDSIIKKLKIVFFVFSLFKMKYKYEVKTCEITPQNIE